MGPRDHQRTSRNPLAAIIASALTGAAATVVAFMIAQLVMAPEFLASLDIGLFAMLLLWLLYVFIACLIVWTVGLLLLGGPVWFFLHQLGFRGPIIATAAGAVLTSSVLTGLLVAVGYGPEPLRSALAIIALFGLLTGAPAGYMLWRVAYTRVHAEVDPS